MKTSFKPSGDGHVDPDDISSLGSVDLSDVNLGRAVLESAIGTRQLLEARSTEVFDLITDDVSYGVPQARSGAEGSEDR